MRRFVGDSASDICMTCHGSRLRASRAESGCFGVRSSAMAQARVYDSTSWRRLRLQVLKRDNYQCQVRLTGCTVVATSVDHIRPVHLCPELGLEPFNCRSACVHCNSVLGARYGNSLRANSQSQARKRSRRPNRRWPVAGFSDPQAYW
jgi:5-methylcytosine-specific restriction protein A